MRFVEWVGGCIPVQLSLSAAGACDAWLVLLCLRRACACVCMFVCVHMCVCIYIYLYIDDDDDCLAFIHRWPELLY